MSPSIIRVGAGEPFKGRALLGLQTGPRLSAPYSTTGSSFVGDRNSFAIPQFSFAYDLDGELPIDEAFSLHGGLQGEFYYPFPLPGYGVTVGASYRKAFGRFSISPALAMSGATDFGIGAIGGPGTIASGELTTNFAVETEDGSVIGFVPFVGIHRIYATGADTPTLFTGFTFVLHVGSGRSRLQAMGGFGRVFTPDVPSWNVPILGAHAGR